MPQRVFNFVNREDVPEIVAPIFRCIGIEAMQKRMTVAAIAHVKTDKRNAQRVQPKHLAGRPQWVFDRLTEGRELWFFVLHPDCRAELEAASTAAARLRDILDARGEPLDHSDMELRLAARKLLDKCKRLSFEALQTQLQKLAQFEEAAHAARRRRADFDKPRWPRERIGVRGGAYWQIVPSPSALYQAGCELHNCWMSEKNAETAPYAALLCAMRTQFWTLHEREGGPATMGLMFDCGLNTIVEARGPGNAPVTLRNVAVREFMRAKACTTMLATFDTRAVDLVRLRRIEQALDDDAPDGAGAEGEADIRRGDEADDV